MKNLRIITALLLVSTLFSCASANMSHKKSGDVLSENSSDDVGRKIIYKAYLSLKVDNVDTANYHLVKIIEKHEGYIKNKSISETTLRVKSDKTDKVVTEISTLGKIDIKRISSNDVTDSYLDYGIRLDNAEKARVKYLELLTKADNVESAIKVEKELERLNETIDMLKGKINKINNKSEYSTITVSMEKRKKPGIIGYVFVGLYEGVRWLFVRG